MRKGILFEAEVPAYGYAVYRVLQEGPNIPMPESTMTQARNTISNGMVTVVIDETMGAPCSIKKAEKSCLRLLPNFAYSVTTGEPGA